MVLSLLPSVLVGLAWSVQGCRGHPLSSFAFGLLASFVDMGVWGCWLVCLLVLALPCGGSEGGLAWLVLVGALGCGDAKGFLALACCCLLVF